MDDVLNNQIADLVVKLFDNLISPKIIRRKSQVFFKGEIPWTSLSATIGSVSLSPLS